MKNLGCVLLLFVVAGCTGASEPAAPAGSATTPTPSAAGTANSGPSDYLDAALAAATWIRSTAISETVGRSWPADPHDTASVVTNLYTGTPGTVLFFLELAAYTGDRTYLNDATAGADFLIAQLDAALPANPNGEDSIDATMANAGLYTGLAGVGFVLFETFNMTGDERYRDGAMRAVDRIFELQREVGAGVDWVDSTDIVSGSAGTGLFLLYAARQTGRPALLAMARNAGDRLLEVAEPHETGLGWRINPEYPRLMPNFSHGTAGVAYFMAALHEATGEAAYLDAAIAGARRLLSLAETEGDVCLVFHHTDGGEQLQYLSWCHGPAGTARTFYKLWQITGDPEWLEWTERSANGVSASGIPETLTEGFWNNVGQCCGSAGVAEFSLAMHEISGEQQHLAFATRVTDNMLQRATEDAGGLMWIQAENRVQPEFLVAQTGYMQGAAGIGMMLLHLDAAQSGKPSPRIAFPDSPY